MGASRWPFGGLVTVLLVGCGPSLIVPECLHPSEATSPGIFATAQYAGPLRAPWTRRQMTSPSSEAARLATPADRSQFRQPDSAENYRGELIQAIDSGRRSQDEIYQVQSMQWSRKYARTIYFTAIGYSPRMEPQWHMYGQYFLAGATANKPGTLIMYNQPLE